MPRPRKVDRPQRVEFQLPASLYARMQLVLFSPIEGRVPVGRVSELYTRLTQEWLDSLEGTNNNGHT